MAGTKQVATNGPKVTGTVETVGDFVPGMTWEDLGVGADQIAGSDLAKGELLDSLVGVPFLIHRVTFYPGTGRIDGERKAFVACEAVIASSDVLRRRRVDMSTLPFEPDAQVVFNDGSTGIYRQIVAYLDQRGLIVLPEGEESGSETRYDLPPSKWTEVRGGEIAFDTDGFARYQANIRLVCPRGLRKSEYQNDYGDAATRYLG